MVNRPGRGCESKPGTEQRSDVACSRVGPADDEILLSASVSPQLGQQSPLLGGRPDQVQE